MTFSRLAGALIIAGATCLALPQASAAAAPARIAHASLSSVSCVTSNFCVAVGAVASDTNIDNVIEMWNGSTWQRRKAPIPKGGRFGALASVTCTSRHFCMAVGDWTGTNDSGTIGEVWNGTKWKFVKAPTTGQFGESFYGVSCVSRTMCVAVGERFRAESSTVLSEVWNGKSWKLVSTPRPPTDEARLSSVSCTAVNRCVSVGSYNEKSVGSRPLAEVWNGKAWAITKLPNPDHSQHRKGEAASGLSDVSCTAARKCVAVGTVGNLDKSKPLIERWNGRHWQRLAPASTGSRNSHFSGVSCVSARRCRAVGNSSAPGGDTDTLVQVWTGTSWTTQPSPSPEKYSNFSAISCLSTTNCLAVGSTDPDPEGNSNAHTLAEHWNGAAWQVVASR
jgi:hypothetical protein